MDTRKLFVDNFDRLKNHRYAGDNFEKILSQPRAFWYGWGRYDKKKLPEKSISRLLKRAGEDIVTLVLYNIPDRDLLNYSRGGASSFNEYKEYVDSFAKGIDRKCIVVVEPDALPHLLSIEGDQYNLRSNCIKYAVETLVHTDATVYIDVGHPEWLTPNEISILLLQTYTDIAHGISVNVSNYRTTKESIEWANKICELRSNDCYVVDTSRNGNGPHGNEWCNPPGRALGEPPTCITGEDRCDAFLWIKIPGESDGKGNGGPRAGRMWGEQAEELVRNTSWIKTFS